MISLKICRTNSNIHVPLPYYPDHLHDLWLLYEDHLCDISLHFSNHAQCFANLQILNSISNRSRGREFLVPISLPHLYLQKAITKCLSCSSYHSGGVIKKGGLSCPRFHQRIPKGLTCALHYHHISAALKLPDGSRMRALLLFCSCSVFSP